MTQKEKLSEFVKWVHANNFGKTPYTGTIAGYFLQRDGRNVRVFTEAEDGFQIEAQVEEDSRSGAFETYRELASYGEKRIEEFVEENSV